MRTTFSMSVFEAAPKGAIGLLAAALLGCGAPGPQVYPVSGSVTYDGEPVLQGDILFVPMDSSLAPDAGKVQDGRFDTLAKQGACRVEITALDINPDTPVIMGSAIAENFIPERYNRESKLTVQVSASEDNTYDFSLSSEDQEP